MFIRVRTCLTCNSGISPAFCLRELYPAQNVRLKARVHIRNSAAVTSRITYFCESAPFITLTKFQTSNILQSGVAQSV